MPPRTATATGAAPRQRRPSRGTEERRAAEARAARRRRARIRRRRLGTALGLLLAIVLALAATGNLPSFHRAVKEIELPLRHDDIIRQQAREKGVDPSLIAAVIYAESHFVEGRESHAGALGLMQITPETAHDIARRSGGTAFTTEDLATPQVNISYGTYHLRFLLAHYNGAVLPAVAAYNAGQGNVDRWIARLRGRGRELTADAIPYPETREYVRKVLDAEREYARRYRRELGL